jgi:DNA-binding transcriptional LysR family regulator
MSKPKTVKSGKSAKLPAAQTLREVVPERGAQRRPAWAGSWATLRDLEVLATVIEERKTTVAALKLGVSQPAISRTLSLLEQKAGRALFRREGTALVPTADALSLYEEIAPIFLSLGRLKDFAWGQALTTTLRVAAPPSLAQCFLEELSADFLRGHPDICLSMDIVTTPEVLALVADQHVDVGVADVVAPGGGLRRSVFRRGLMVCLIPADHALARQDHITPHDLDGERLIMLAKRNPVRPTLERVFDDAGVKPQARVETSTAISAVTYVSRGLGIALLNPFPITAQLNSNVVVRPFSANLPYETSFFLSGSAVPSAAVQQYIEFIRHRQSAADAWSAPVI